MAADSVSRCLPTASSSLDLFADDQCSQGIVALPTGSAAPPVGTFFIAQTLDGSPATFAMFASGVKIAAPAKVWQRASACQEVAQPPQDYYATDPIAPSEFAAITRLVE